MHQTNGPVCSLSQGGNPCSEKPPLRLLHWSILHWCSSIQHPSSQALATQSIGLNNKMSHQPTFFSFSRLTLEASGSARPLTETGSGIEKRASSSSCTSKAVVSSVLFSLAACSAFCLGAATKVDGFVHAFMYLTLHVCCTLSLHSCRLAISHQLQHTMGMQGLSSPNLISRRCSDVAL